MEQSEKEREAGERQTEELKQHIASSPQVMENQESNVSQNAQIISTSEIKPKRKQSADRRNWWEEERKYFSEFLEQQEQQRTEILSHQYLISSVLRVFLSKIDKQLDVANRIKLALEKQAMMCLLYLEERKRAKEKQSEIIRGLVPSLEEAIENQERSIKESHKACLGQLNGMSELIQVKISEGIDTSQILANKKKELTEFQNIVKILKQAVQAIEQSEIERERDIKRSGALIGPHTPEDLFIKMKSYASLFSDKLQTYTHFIKAVIEFLYSAFQKYDSMNAMLVSNLKKFHQIKAKLYGGLWSPMERQEPSVKIIEQICQECTLGMKIQSLEDIYQALRYRTPKVELSIFVIKHDTLKTNFKQAANWQPRELIATRSRYLYVFAPESSGKWEARFDMRQANLRLGAPDQQNRELIFQINQEVKEKNLLSNWFGGKPTKLFVETRSVDNLIEWVHALTD